MGRIRYEIISVIKESNKGKVYLASVEGYGFPVIVKQLKRGDRKVYDALRVTENNHIPRIYDLEENDGELLVVEEYIEGELLSVYLTERRLTESEYISIAKQLCEGLRSLHQCNPPVIHRDIKPSNVIVNSEGIVKIIDFDSSRQYKEESESDTRLLGTEKYAAPEQYGFSQTDCRSDIYSLGVVFGSIPGFVSEKKNRRWKRLVEKCTLFAPESRFQTVEEIERELKKIEEAGNVRKGILAGAISICLVLFIVLLGVFCKARDIKETSGEPPTPVPEPVWESEPATSPSPTPLPTPLPTATPTSTPLPGPTPTLLPLDLGETVVNSTRADMVGLTISENSPEGRISEEDLPEVAVLKRKIAINKSYVQYYFKDRMQRDDLLTYTSFFDDARESFVGVKLYSYQSGEWMRLSCTEAYEKDGICHIDGRFMDGLPDGFYLQVIQYRMEGDKGIREHSVYVYVAESDDFNEPSGYIDGNRIEYRGEKGITLHTITRNSFEPRIESVHWTWGDELDPSLYTILYGGRAVEYSAYLLEKFMENGEIQIYLKMSDGTKEYVVIRVEPNML